MGFTNLCALVLWMKVLASALEGFKFDFSHRGQQSKDLCFSTELYAHICPVFLEDMYESLLLHKHLRAVPIDLSGMTLTKKIFPCK